MANKRITDVDFIESLDSDESFFVNKNNSIKQINKGNIIFDIVNGGTGASDAATARKNLGITRENLGITAENIGASPIDHTHDVNEIITEALPISMGGTGSTNGAEALQKMLSEGYLVLNDKQFGDKFPDETDESYVHTKGVVFLKKVNV